MLVIEIFHRNIFKIMNIRNLTLPTFNVRYSAKSASEIFRFCNYVAFTNLEVVAQKIENFSDIGQRKIVYGPTTGVQKLKKLLPLSEENFRLLASNQYSRLEGLFSC